MIIALDVHYHDDGSAVCAAVGFERFDSPAACWSVVARVDSVAPYEPGHFAARELPCLLAALPVDRSGIDCVVIDGFVDLGEDQRPGLGRRLFESLGCSVPMVGVAKTRFAGTPESLALRRGASSRPLYVGCAGMDHGQAMEGVASMAGPHRIPAMLSAVDGLCRRPEEGLPRPARAQAAKPKP